MGKSNKNIYISPKATKNHDGRANSACASPVRLQQSGGTAGAWSQPGLVGWLLACLVGGRTRGRRKKKSPPPPLASSCVCCSAPPTNKRSSRSAAAAHWRTRSSESSAQSQDPQSPQPIRGYTGGPGAAGGWGKKKEKRKKRRKTTAGRPVSLHRPLPLPRPHSALPPSRHQPRGRTPHRPLFF